MTKYEMLQSLLNDPDLQKSIVNHLSCVRAEMILHKHSSNYFSLDVHIIKEFEGKEVLMYVEMFEFDLSNRNSLQSFMIRLFKKSTVDEALKTAKLGEIIEDFLQDRLN